MLGQVQWDKGHRSRQRSAVMLSTACSTSDSEVGSTVHVCEVQRTVQWAVQCMRAVHQAVHFMDVQYSGQYSAQMCSSLLSTGSTCSAFAAQDSVAVLVGIRGTPDVV